MEQKKDEKELKESSFGNNLSFFLPEGVSFLEDKDTAFIQDNGHIVPFMKGRYNGTGMLYCRTGDLIRLDYLLKVISAEKFLKVTSGIMNALAAMKEDNRFNYGNLLIKIDHVFVEPGSYEVRFIYIPAETELFSDHFEQEKTFFRVLHSAIQRDWLEDPGVREAAEKLKRGLPSGAATAQKEKGIRLKEKGSPDQREILITKPSFVIGRSPLMADGILSDKAVSRQHCKINIESRRCWITDMDSTYGTFVNGHRISNGMPTEIKNGDEIRLANCSFILYCD